LRALRTNPDFVKHEQVSFRSLSRRACHGQCG
jgi:hypothetical protein